MATNSERVTAYQKENTKCYQFRLNTNYDRDLIEFMETVENKAEFFKTLIREKMEKSQRAIV